MKNKEEHSIWQEKFNRIRASDEYKFIQQFARKFKIQEDRKELLNLQKLLEKYEWHFSLDELEKFVEIESKKQNNSNLKLKILENTDDNFYEIIKSYLKNYTTYDDEMMRVLIGILKEKKLYFGTPKLLKYEIWKLERQIELDEFEKRLSNEDELIDLKSIDYFNGYEFEDFLKTLFSKMGYQVEQTRLSGDQGADLVAIKFGKRIVIQAKRFSGKVGNKAVQEIMGAISLYKANNGMVVTNNYFTSAAIELADANKIALIDRDALKELINKHW